MIVCHQLLGPQLSEGVERRGTGRGDAGELSPLRLGLHEGQPARQLSRRGLGRETGAQQTIPTTARASRLARARAGRLAAAASAGAGSRRVGRATEALRQIRDGLAGEAYFFQTIFSPLSVAKYLAGNQPGPVLASIADHPDALARRARRHHRNLQRTTSRPHWRRARAASSSRRPAGPAATYSPRSSIAASGATSICVCWRWRRGKRRSTSCTTAANTSTSTCWQTIRSRRSVGRRPCRGIRRWARAKSGRQRAVMGGVSEKTTLPDGTPEQVDAEVRAGDQGDGGPPCADRAGLLDSAAHPRRQPGGRRSRRPRYGGEVGHWK